MGSCFSTYVSMLIHAPDIWTNNMALFMKAEYLVFQRNAKSANQLGLHKPLELKSQFKCFQFSDCRLYLYRQ